jgi:hypothetical protein
MIVTCKHCEIEYDVSIKQEDYDEWRDMNGYLHTLTEYLSAGDRELLISQTCDDCWNKLYE